MNDSPVCPEGGYLRARTPPGRWGAAAGPRCACRIRHGATAGRKQLDGAGYPRPSAPSYPPYPPRPLQGPNRTCRPARDTPSAARRGALGLLPLQPPPPPLLLPPPPLTSASGLWDAKGGSGRVPLLPVGEILGSDWKVDSHVQPRRRNSSSLPWGLGFGVGGRDLESRTGGAESLPEARAGVEA